MSKISAVQRCEIIKFLKKCSSSIACNIFAALLIPLVWLYTTECLQRGNFIELFTKKYFINNIASYIFTWILIFCVYLFVLFLSRKHYASAIATGIISNLFGIISYFKQQIRSEPFLPADIFQIKTLTGVIGEIKLSIEPFMIIVLAIIVVVCIASCFIKFPNTENLNFKKCIIISALPLITGVLIVFNVFLNVQACDYFKMEVSTWWQTLGYAEEGVISSFLMNIRYIRIIEPFGYSEKAVDNISEIISEKTQAGYDIFENSLNENSSSYEQTPNIIFIMSEGYFNPYRIEGIEYDIELTSNLKKLQAEGAYGKTLVSAYGGGTCDVEFEALTGYSIEHLPTYSKPYEQHIKKEIPSYVSFLKEQDYETVAIHPFKATMWSRDKVYPLLGFESFYSIDSFINPQMSREFISDLEVTNKIIETLDNKHQDKPIFIHTVTIQNHASYYASKYPKDEMVNIINPPQELTEEDIGSLQDYATGMYEADYALGELTNYLKTYKEPVIIVFWGDHLNNVTNNSKLLSRFDNFSLNGLKPTLGNLYQTDMVIWSNYASVKEDLGIISAFQLAPVMTKLYGMKRPELFDFLLQSIPQVKGYARGFTVSGDNSVSEERTSIQENIFKQHAMLQYDLMFGKKYLLNE